MTSITTNWRFPLLIGFSSLIAVRALVGIWLAFRLVPVSVDDYFRVFHALWWWEHPSFTSSHEWLPGHSYIYGSLIGLTGNTTLTPRILSLLLQLAGVAVLALDRVLPRAVRWMAAIWILCSPLALVLGTVPLTETLFALLLLIGIVALELFISNRKSPFLLLAAVGYLGATMVRYDAWVLLPIYTAFALSVKPEKYFVLANRALAFLPWFFALVWTLLLWAFQGEPFSYLRIVKEDHFGAGSLIDPLTTPFGLVTALQICLAVVALCGAAISLIRRRRGVGDLLWECHLFVALAFVMLVVINGNVPSQFSLRLLFPALLFAAVPLARWVSARIFSRGRMIALGIAIAVFLLVLGVILSSGLAPGVREDNLRAAAFLREAFWQGDLDVGDHALIEHHLPDAAAVLVYSEHPARVHIDMLGGNCPPRLLGTVELFCPVESWSADVRTVLVRSSDAAQSLKLRGWRNIATFGSWTVYRRTPNGIPLGHRFEQP